MWKLMSIHYKNVSLLSNTNLLEEYSIASDLQPKFLALIVER